MKTYIIQILIAAIFLASCAGSRKVTIDASPGAKQKELAAAVSGPAKGKIDPNLEIVALFSGPMPTGVTVSKSGRTFVCLPRWTDNAEYTVIEIIDGKAVPFPDAETNQFDVDNSERFHPASHLVSVQSVVADSKDRLWLLDSGSINLAPVLRDGPKLWGYDLSTGKKIKQVIFPNDVVLKTTYLNDIRIELKRGNQGFAYITDSGAGGIITVDLSSGKSWRHLDNHYSVKPLPNLKQYSEGEEFLERKPSDEISSPDFRSDGIAISPDNKVLYYTPLASRVVYSVPTDLLADQFASEEKVGAAVQTVATKPSGNDGLITDIDGTIYSTDFEDSSIRKINPKTGSTDFVVQDQRLLWPDTLSLHNGYLYILNNQLARQPGYHFGKDKRVKPYALFRVRLNSLQMAADTH